MKKKKKNLLNKISSSRWSNSEVKFYKEYLGLFKKYPDKFFNNFF